MLTAALSAYTEATESFRAAIGEAHLACPHTAWVERSTFKIAEWMNPHRSWRICQACRAEIHDVGIYRDWLAHGEYSVCKPDQVQVVLTPAQAGVEHITNLRLSNDPRPHFGSFAEVLDWRPSC